MIRLHTSLWSMSSSISSRARGGTCKIVVTIGNISSLISTTSDYTISIISFLDQRCPASDDLFIGGNTQPPPLDLPRNYNTPLSSILLTLVAKEETNILIRVMLVSIQMKSTSPQHHHNINT